MSPDPNLTDRERDIRFSVAKYALDDTKKKLEVAKDAGCDITRADVYYTEALSALDDEEYRKAFALARLAKDTVTEILDAAGIQAITIPVDDSPPGQNQAPKPPERSIYNDIVSSSPPTPDITGHEPTAQLTQRVATKQDQPEAFEPAAQAGRSEPPVVEPQTIPSPVPGSSSSSSLNEGSIPVSVPMDDLQALSPPPPGSPPPIIPRAEKEGRHEMDPVQRIAVEGALTLAQHALDGIREFEIYDDDAEEQFISAEQMYYQGEFKKALEHARVCIETATTIRTNHIIDQSKRNLPLAEAKFKQVTGYGLDTSQMAAMLEKAQAALDNHNYLESWNISKLLRQTCVDAVSGYLKDRAKRAVQAAKGQYKRALKFDVAPEEALKYIEKAREALNNSEYENAEGLARVAIRYCSSLLAELPITKAEKALEDAETILDHAQNLELDVMQEGLLIEQARIELQSANYQEVIDSTARARTSLKKKLTIALRRSAERMLQTAEAKVLNVKKLGISDHKAVTLYNQAVNAFDNGEFEQAEDLADQSRRLARNVILDTLAKKALRAITSAKQKIEDAKILGLDVTDAIKNITSAEYFFKNAIYDQAEMAAHNAMGVIDMLAYIHDKLDGEKS